MFLLPGAGGPKLLWEILVTPTSESSHPRGKPDFQWRCWRGEVLARGHTAVREALAGWDHGSLQGKQGTWVGGRGSSPELLGHCESRGLLFSSYFTSSVQKHIIYSSYQIEKKNLLYFTSLDCPFHCFLKGNSQWHAPAHILYQLRAIKPKRCPALSGDQLSLLALWCEWQLRHG